MLLIKLLWNLLLYGSANPSSPSNPEPHSKAMLCQRNNEDSYPAYMFNNPTSIEVPLASVVDINAYTEGSFVYNTGYDTIANISLVAPAPVYGSVIIRTLKDVLIDRKESYNIQALTILEQEIKSLFFASHSNGEFDL